jgi:cytochrome c biogenesis protein CcmG/thiol:disulfide interchange protein DsbE
MTRLAAQLAAVLLAGALSGAAGAAGITGAAPDFSRADLRGNPVHLADYRGKVVLLNFWATWCGPCLDEMPVFARWQKQYGPQGLQVVGVSMDDDAAPVQRFLKKSPLDYPVVLGDTALAKLYGGVLGLPLTYLIDAQGKVEGRYLGGADLSAVETQIKRLLAH